jgi:hypothetical protein
MIIELNDDNKTIIDLNYVSYLGRKYRFETRPVVYPLEISIGNDMLCNVGYGSDNLDNYHEKVQEVYDKYTSDYDKIKNFLLNKNA